MNNFDRLKLPGKIHETESSSGSYDCEEGVFALRFEKVNKGEHFENLDMITTLLVPSKKKTLNIPNIEVIGNKLYMYIKSQGQKYNVFYVIYTSYFNFR